METSSAATNPQFLNPEDLVARWQGTVKETTLSTWRSRGLGPKFVKIGGRVLYRLNDVMIYETRNTRGA